MFGLEDDITLLVISFISLLRCEVQMTWDNAYDFPCWCPNNMWWHNKIETKIMPIEIGTDSKHEQSWNTWYFYD